MATNENFYKFYDSSSEDDSSDSSYDYYESFDSNLKNKINSNFINPLPIHKKYGVKEIPGIKVISINPSKSGRKKYDMIVEYKGKTKKVSFGHKDYQHYEDRSPLKTYSKLNHKDNTRRASYLSRASKITDSTGLAANNPFSPNRYAIIVLW